MRNRLPFLSGLALATLGVSGLAGGGLLWNFQGRTLGLGSTVTALVLLGISFVLLRPEPRLSPVEVPEASQPLKIKAPQASFLGLMLAILGTFGMAGSGLLWNFQGLAFGLTGTLTAAVALLLSLVFLWPSAPPRPKHLSRPSRWRPSKLFRRAHLPHKQQQRPLPNCWQPSSSSAQS